MWKSNFWYKIESQNDTTPSIHQFTPRNSPLRFSLAYHIRHNSELILKIMRICFVVYGVKDKNSELGPFYIYWSVYSQNSLAFMGIFWHGAKDKNLELRFHFWGRARVKNLGLGLSARFLNTLVCTRCPKNVLLSDLKQNENDCIYMIFFLVLKFQILKLPSDNS